MLDWGALYLRNELGASVATVRLRLCRLFGDHGDHALCRRSCARSVRRREDAARLHADGACRHGACRPCAECAARHPRLCAWPASAFPTWCRSPFRLPATCRAWQPGIGLSVATFMGYSGMLFAPSLIGFVAEHTGFSIIFSLRAGACSSWCCCCRIMPFMPIRKGTTEVGLRPRSHQFAVKCMMLPLTRRLSSSTSREITATARARGFHVFRLRF